MKPFTQIVIRQAGTAYAFAPLLKALEAAGHSFEIICLSTHNASEVLTRFSLPHKTVLDFPQAEPLLKKEAAFFLTGTSEVVNDDILFWRWAKKHKVHTLGYVDQWLHWWKRFTYPMNNPARFNEAPDEILVIDQYSFDEFVRDGCPPEKLRIVGNPAFDDKIDGQKFTPKKVAAPGPYEVLFVSEPYAMDHAQIKDFDEELAFYRVCEAIEKVMPGEANDLTVKIRPHPLESPDKILGYVQKAKERFHRVKIVIDREEKMKSIHSSHCVVGIESILVFESYLMKRPAACYVPPDGEPNPFTFSTPAIAVCRTKPDLEEFFRKTFFEAKEVELLPEHKRKSLPVFLDLILKRQAGA